MAIVNPYLLIITLNINGLNSLMAEWILKRKQDLTICLEKTHFSLKDQNKLRVQKQKENLKKMVNKFKKSGVGILILDKIDFKLKMVRENIKVII